MRVESLEKLECAALKCIQWPELIEDLERSGWWQSDIAAAINVPRRVISSWKYEKKEPMFSNGDGLLRLYSRVFGNSHTLKRIEAFRRQAINGAAIG